jgi:hypothetical protein
METQVARRAPFAETTEEGVEGAVYAQDHLLQDLAMNIRVFWQRFLNARQLGLLLIVADRDAAQSLGFPPLADRSVVDVTAEHQDPLKLLLLWRRFEFVGLANAAVLLFHAPLFCLTGT